ncbi:MAG: transcriptional repressor [Dehalococcoidia bacterium]|nr:MAG: transcriptional repressor [Dehalococcoidia bacterium]
MSSRNTKQKEAILRVLRKTPDHADARWIHLQVRRSLPHISLGTVYRNLKALTEEGHISALDMGSGSRFDGKPGNHAHFHCQKCGAIINLEETSDASMDKNVSDKHRLSVAFHRLDFFGLCPACQRASTPPVNKKSGVQHG